MSSTRVEAIVDAYANACDTAPTSRWPDPRRWFDGAIFYQCCIDFSADKFEEQQAEAICRSLYPKVDIYSEFGHGTGGGKRILRRTDSFT